MQIPVSNQHFSGNSDPFSINNPVARVRVSPEKHINFFQLKISCHRLSNKKGLILSQEKYFKTLKDMVIGTVSTLMS